MVQESHFISEGIDVCHLVHLMVIHRQTFLPHLGANVSHILVMHQVSSKSLIAVDVLIPVTVTTMHIGMFQVDQAVL